MMTSLSTKEVSCSLHWTRLHTTCSNPLLDGDNDVYDSDFMSSDDEAEAELAGENELQAAIRKERRVRLFFAESDLIILDLSPAPGCSQTYRSLDRNVKACGPEAIAT